MLPIACHTLETKEIKYKHFITYLSGVLKIWSHMILMAQTIPNLFYFKLNGDEFCSQSYTTPFLPKTQIKVIILPNANSKVRKIYKTQWYLINHLSALIACNSSQKHVSYEKGEISEEKVWLFIKYIKLTEMHSYLSQM